MGSRHLLCQLYKLISLVLTLNLYHLFSHRWAGPIHGNMTDHDILQLQEFPDVTTAEGKKEARVHYDWLRRFFRHPNYIKVNGSPVFMLYQKKPRAVPVLEQFRQWAIEDGFTGLFLTVGLTKAHEHLHSSAGHAAGHVTGDFAGYHSFNRTVSYPNPKEWYKKTLSVPSWCVKQTSQIRRGSRALRNERDRIVEMPGILLHFDNTPRRSFESASILTPEGMGPVEAFKESLKASLYYESCCFPEEWNKQSHANVGHNAMSGTIASDRDDDRFIIINAWNEWAEGSE